MQLPKWIRDKWITGLLLCALSLSFFITLTGLEMYFNLQSEAKAKAKETYNTTYQWKKAETEQRLSEDPDTFLDLTQLDLKQGNLFLYTDATSVADSSRRIYGNYFYCCNETLKKQFLWGDLSTEKNTVVINELLEPYAYEKDNHWYITIEQEEYEITGVVRSYSDETEGVFYTYYPNITPKLQKHLRDEILAGGTDFYFSYVSDQKIEETNVQQISDWCDTYLPEKEIDCINGTKQLPEETDFSDMYFTFLFILLIFSLSSNIVIIHTWIARRKKELLIRKTFGESTWQIGKKIYSELCLHAGICVLFVLICNFTYHLFTKENYSEYYLSIVLILILAAFALSFLILLIPMIELQKLKPGTALKKD